MIHLRDPEWLEKSDFSVPPPLLPQRNDGNLTCQEHFEAQEPDEIFEETYESSTPSAEGKLSPQALSPGEMYQYSDIDIVQQDNAIFRASIPSPLNLAGISTNNNNYGNEASCICCSTNRQTRNEDHEAQGQPLPEPVVSVAESAVPTSPQFLLPVASSVPEVPGLYYLFSPLQTPLSPGLPIGVPASTPILTPIIPFSVTPGAAPSHPVVAAPAEPANVFVFPEQSQQ